MKQHPRSALLLQVASVIGFFAGFNFCYLNLMLGILCLIAAFAIGWLCRTD